MGGGGQRAAVDKSQQRSDWAATQNASREAQAGAWNNRVNEFNSGLQTYLTGARELQTWANNLTIADDEQFNNFNRQLSDVQSRLSAKAWNETAPDFSSVVNSGIGDDFSGGAVTLNVPSLVRPNTTAYNEALNILNSASSRFQQVQNDRRAEEQRIANALQQGAGAVRTFQSRLGDLDLGDFADSRQNLQSGMNDMRNQINTFSSPIMHEFMTNEQQALRSGKEEIATWFRNLDNDRRTEEQRIRSTSTDLQNRANALNAELVTLGLGDEARIRAINAELGQIRQQATGFQSPLDFNFSSTLGILDNAGARLTGLQQERRAEEQRLQEAARQMEQDAFGIEQQVGNADFFNLANLTNLSNRIGQMRFQAQNFQSPLTPNFSSPLARLQSAEEALTALRGQRQTELDSLVGRVRSEMTGIEDIPLENEQAIMDRRTRLGTLESQLGRFSGNDLNEERAVFTEAMTTFDNRLRQLADRRSAIEQRARQLQAAIANGSFLQMSDLDPRQAELAQLRAEQELFNATQALDELDSIANTLTQQRQRVERDIAARTAASGSERDAMLRQLGIAATGSMGGSTAFTPEQIAALLSGISRRRDELPAGVQSIAAPSAFSQLAMAA